MPFLKCKKCIVRACCREVCNDFKEYAQKKYRITIGNGISLKQAKLAFGNIDLQNVDLYMSVWNLTTTENSKVLVLVPEKNKKGE